MQLKKQLIFCLVATLSAAPLLADTASRCLNMMDKRVQEGVLNLSNCNLTPQHAGAILNYLAAHYNTIHTLNIDDNPNFGSAGMVTLATNDTLTTLSFTNCEVGNEGFAALAKNMRLQKLIRHDRFSANKDEAPAKLAGNMELTSVDFSADQLGQLGGVTAKALASIDSLQEVNLRQQSNIGNESVTALSKLPNLHKLNVASIYYVGAPSLLLIAQNPQITELAMGHYSVTLGEKTYAALAKNSSITKLELEISPDDVKYFPLFKNNLTIRSLNVAWDLDDEAIRTIASMKNLEELSVGVTSASLNYLGLIASDLPKLKKLTIRSTDFLDINTVNQLAMNKTITDLSVRNLTEAAALELAKSTTLQHLTIDNDFNQVDSNNVELILNKSLGELAKIPSLVELNYEGNYRIDQTVAANMTSNMNLNTIRIARDQPMIMGKITNPAMAIFAHDNHLTELALSSDDIDDANVLGFASNTSLRRLSFETVKLSDKGVKAIAKNSTLNSVKLKINAITASAYNALMGNTNIPIIDVEINFPNPDLK